MPVDILTAGFEKDLIYKLKYSCMFNNNKQSMTRPEFSFLK